MATVQRQPGSYSEGEDKNAISRKAILLSMLTSALLSLWYRKPRVAAPTTNMASVARRSGSPRIALTPLFRCSSWGPYHIKAPKMATIGIMGSGRAVPTAASTLLTTPCPQPNRSPNISMELVNREAVAKIVTTEITNSMSVTSDTFL
jgi:hypothetical protein